MVSSPDVGDLSPEGPLPPLILLQQLLSAATQPSPIKAIFDRQEMEVRKYTLPQKADVKSMSALLLQSMRSSVLGLSSVLFVCAGGSSGSVSVPGCGICPPFFSTV